MSVGRHLPFYTDSYKFIQNCLHKNCLAGSAGSAVCLRKNILTRNWLAYLAGIASQSEPNEPNLAGIQSQGEPSEPNWLANLPAKKSQPSQAFGNAHPCLSQ